MKLHRVILLVDNDIEDQEIFIDAIKEIDGSILCLCSNGAEEALKLLTGDLLQKPDLIFLDLNMPGVNGKQLLATLKKTESLRDIPVIMLSTFVGETDVVKLEKLGAAHFLLKPPNFDKLIKSLSFVLTKKW
jgi:CheY-like chemotaxis protein